MFPTVTQLSHLLLIVNFKSLFFVFSACFLSGECSFLARKDLEKTTASDLFRVRFEIGDPASLNLLVTGFPLRIMRERRWKSPAVRLFCVFSYPYLGGSYYSSCQLVAFSKCSNYTAVFRFIAQRFHRYSLMY